MRLRNDGVGAVMDDSETGSSPPDSSANVAKMPIEVWDRVRARRRELAERLGTMVDQDRAITLELGCGHGHWLTGYAEKMPVRMCLGIDLLSGRIRKAQAKAEKRGLEHLHFIKAEAGEVLAAWPREVKVDEVFMLFPDPWPKKRHHKNRMLQWALLDSLAAITCEGARFHFRTDDADYFSWTRERLDEHLSWDIRNDLDWPWEAPSYFQDMMDSWQSLIARRVDGLPMRRSAKPEK